MIRGSRYRTSSNTHLAQFRPAAQLLLDAAGERLDPLTLQPGQPVQLGGTLTSQYLLQASGLRRWA